MSNNILMMENRQLIPRWHTSRKIHQLKFKQNAKLRTVGKIEDDYWFHKSLEEWKTNPTVSNAIELFAKFIQYDELSSEDFYKVQRLLLDNYDYLPKAVKSIIIPDINQAIHVNGYSTEIGDVSLIINHLKEITRINPRDSLSWMDLGFYYSVLNEFNKAKSCIGIAKNIDPNNSYISRANSRFLVQIGEPEKAIWFLKNREDLYSNPLVLSAYIAIGTSFDLIKPHLKKAWSLVESWKNDNALISELAASLGTIEIDNGAIKKGKKLLAKSLLNPSENVVSHINWLYHKHNIIIPKVDYTESSIESSINNLYSNSKFIECRDKLIEMYRFQPYSIGPIVDASYLSISALNDPDFVIETLGNRIHKAHMEFSELNNLVVAKLLKGQTENIDIDLRVLSRRMDKNSHDQKATLIATLGMACITNGEFIQGQELYEKSITIFKNNKMEKQLALAYHFYSSQIKDVSPEKSLKLSNESKKLAKKHKLLELLK